MSASVLHGKIHIKGVVFWLQTLVYAVVFWYATSVTGKPQELIGTLLFCGALVFAARKLKGNAFRRASAICTVLGTVCIALYGVSDWFALAALPLLAVGLAGRCVCACEMLPGKRFILPFIAVIVLGNVISAAIETLPAWIPALLLLVAIPMPALVCNRDELAPVRFTRGRIAVLALFILHSQFMGYFIRDMLAHENFAAIQPLTINIASILGYVVFAVVFVVFPLRASLAVLMLSFVAGYAIYLIPVAGLEPAYSVCSLFAAGGNDIVLLVLPILLWENNRSPLLAVSGLLLARMDYALTLGVEMFLPSGWTESDAGRIGAAVAIVVCFALVLVINRVNLKGDAKPAAGRQPLPDTLTSREREVALLLLEGCKRKTIAERMAISPSTLNKHCNAIYRKTGCDGQFEFNGKYSNYSNLT